MSIIPLVLEMVSPMAEVELQVYMRAVMCLDDDAGPGTCMARFESMDDEKNKKRRLLLEQDSDEDEDEDDVCEVIPLFDQCRYKRITPATFAPPTLDLRFLLLQDGRSFVVGTLENGACA